jgi:hypothetical protein
MGPAPQSQRAHVSKASLSVPIHPRPTWPRSHRGYHGNWPQSGGVLRGRQDQRLERCRVRRLGCYTQYVVMRSERVIGVRDDLACKEAAPIELAMCVGSTILMLKDMNMLRGRRVGIMGLCPAGLVAVQMAKGRATPSRPAMTTGYVCVDIRAITSGPLSMPCSLCRMGRCAWRRSSATGAAR